MSGLTAIASGALYWPWRCGVTWWPTARYIGKNDADITETAACRCVARG
jgi:hypothetical protein